MYGCLLTLLSQALMAMSLSGERSRVSVHDLHEQHNLVGSATQFGNSLQHTVEHMPLLNSTDVAHALSHPSSLLAGGGSLASLGQLGSSFGGFGGGLGSLGSMNSLGKGAQGAAATLAAGQQFA